MEEVKSGIAVLLATYNGAVFLEEQLDSLLNQTYQDFKIFVRDDGSSDSTMDIVTRYVEKYPDKFKLLDDDIRHRGPRDAFLWMLDIVESDYYMFCDQDDVWLPNKIELSINKVKKIEGRYPGVPVMVHTDLIVVDENLDTIYPSFFKWGKFNVDLNKRLCFAPFGNVFTGCTMIFNYALKKHLLPIPDFAQMHDQWVGLMAVKYGKVDNIKTGTIKYRQHTKNVCSTGRKKRFTLKDFVKRSGWYEMSKPIFQELDYGPKIKAYFFKAIYSFSRIFFHD